MSHRLGHFVHRSALHIHRGDQGAYAHLRKFSPLEKTLQNSGRYSPIVFEQSVEGQSVPHISPPAGGVGDSPQGYGGMVNNFQFGSLEAAPMTDLPSVKDSMHGRTQTG